MSPSDILELILQVWSMYHSNPLFWIILILVGLPMVLWWWNFLRKQSSASGLTRLLISLWSSITSRLLRRRVEDISVVTPSTRSGLPSHLWRELMLWPLMIAPLFIFILFTLKGAFSSQWWVTVGIIVISLFVVMGVPVYVATVVGWLRITRVVKTASERMQQSNACNNRQRVSYLDVFAMLADDLRMGLDPRVIPIVLERSEYKIDAPSVLSELVRLRLIKPDRKMKHSLLARRYYLTRSGATLAEKTHQERKKDPARLK